MNECQKRGHRVIKMICDECGQEVNRATFTSPLDKAIQELVTLHKIIHELHTKIADLENKSEMK
jgi:hypothetical protein